MVDQAVQGMRVAAQGVAPAHLEGGGALRGALRLAALAPARPRAPPMTTSLQ